MSSPPNPIDQLLKTAHLQYKQGNVSEARKLTMQILEKDPAIEEAWLILASASSLDQAIAYLKHASKLLPNSTRINTMLSKAMKQNEANGQPNSATERSVPPINPMPATLSQESVTPQAAPQQTPQTQKKRAPTVIFWLILLATLIGSFLLLSNRDLITTFAMAQKSSKEVERPAEAFLKPTRTPTNTLTPTPTPTPTPSPTPTLTNTPTATFTPTFTPTNTLAPTNTLPAPTQINVTADERWIDIDLSNQMLYAYEGDTIINSFLISSGMVNTPTVVGQFAVYVKYEYATMSGPGYYIPDVPYTMYYYKDYGIHAATWHNNFGTPMSHGCINMRLDEAEWIFNWSSVGTTVNIHY